MPEELFWADDPMSRHQHNQVRKEAAKEIRENRARIAELEAHVSRLQKEASEAGAEALEKAASDLEKTRGSSVCDECKMPELWKVGNWLREEARRLRDGGGA